VIDYDIALLMGPTSVLGSTYGTMINVVFSDYIIFICMYVEGGGRRKEDRGKRRGRGGRRGREEVGGRRRERR
jgi:hypothetical protein